jgi:tetratricopeptide (TPR) repeat protein
MNNLGFLYVLANSAMPGLVKVGKTTRTPSERAGELSGVTGIPTPFIVIYEQLFQDCDAAETFVHTYLAQKGHRVSDAREFFNAPSNIVIRAFGLAPGAIDGSATESDTDSADEFFERRAPDELDALILMQSPQTNPWDDVLAEADNYYYGHDDYIQDYAEALRLYLQSAKLGSIAAYKAIGGIYELGEGVRIDAVKALNFYKEGARKGSWFCYWKMGMLFGDQGNYDNADKCFSLFLKNLPLTLDDDSYGTNYEFHRVISTSVSLILRRRWTSITDLHSILNDFFAQWSIRIHEVAADRSATTAEPGLREEYEGVIRYLDSLSSKPL